jgi:peptidoglycan L-alanyl-D-glutamate endopeptidase CwlK
MSLVKREEVYGVIKQATHDVRMQLSAEHQRIMKRYMEWIEKPVLLEHVWDSYSRERILTLNPAIQQMTINFIVEMQAHGMNLRISQAFRTNEEQDRLYNRSRNGNTEPWATDARGGESYHNYGMAIDVVEIINKETNWQFNKAWVADIAMQYGFEWPLPVDDPCHFQVSKGYTTRQLLEMVRNGNTKDGHIVFE